MEIYPGLACIWTNGDLSGLSFFTEVHKLPILHTLVCAHIRQSTDQSLVCVGGKGVFGFCRHFSNGYLKLISLVPLTTELSNS